MKEAQRNQAVSVLTPIQQAVKTLNDIAALRDEIKHLEDRLMGEEVVEAGPPKVAYGEPAGLLARVDRASEDAQMALAEARDGLMRISRALFGRE